MCWSLDNEIWVTLDLDSLDLIDGYLLSDKGRVSLNGIIIDPTITNDNQLIVELQTDKGTVQKYIKWLVSYMFLSSYLACSMDNYFIDFADGDTLNCSSENVMFKHKNLSYSKIKYFQTVI